MTSLRTLSVDALKRILELLPIDSIVALHETNDKAIRRSITSTVALPSVDLDRNISSSVWCFLKYHGGLRSLSVHKSLHEHTIAGPFETSNGFGALSMYIHETMFPPLLLTRLPSSLTSLSIAANFHAPAQASEDTYYTFGDLLPSLTSLELRETRPRNANPQANYLNMKMMEKLPPNLHTLVLGATWSVPPLDALPSTITSFTLTSAYPILCYAYGDWTAATGLIQRERARSAFPTVDALRVLIPRLPRLQSLSVIVSNFQLSDNQNQQPQVPGMMYARRYNNLQQQQQYPQMQSMPRSPAPLEDEASSSTPKVEPTLLALPAKLDTLRISLRGPNPDELSLLLRSAPHITAFAFEGNGNHIAPELLKWKVPASLVHIDLFPAAFDQTHHHAPGPNGPSVSSFTSLFKACPHSVTSLNIKGTNVNGSTSSAYGSSSTSAWIDCLPFSLQTLTATNVDAPSQTDWPPHLTHIKIASPSSASFPMPTASSFMNSWSPKLTYFHVDNFTLPERMVEMLPTSLTRLHCALTYGWSQKNIKQLIVRLTNIRYFSTPSAVNFIINHASLSPDSPLLKSETFKLSAFWQAEMGAIQHLISVPWVVTKARRAVVPGSMFSSNMDVDFDRVAASTVFGDTNASMTGPGFLGTLHRHTPHPYPSMPSMPMFSTGPSSPISPLHTFIPSAASIPLPSFPTTTPPFLPTPTSSTSSPPPPPFPGSTMDRDDDDDEEEGENSDSSSEQLEVPPPKPTVRPDFSSPDLDGPSLGTDLPRRRRHHQAARARLPLSPNQIPFQDRLPIDPYAQFMPSPGSPAAQLLTQTPPLTQPRIHTPIQLQQQQQARILNNLAQHQLYPYPGAPALIPPRGNMFSPQIAPDLDDRQSTVPTHVKRLHFDSDNFPTSNPMSSVTGDTALSYFYAASPDTTELIINSRDSFVLSDHAQILQYLHSSTTLTTLILDNISSENVIFATLPPSLTTLVFGVPALKRETLMIHRSSTLASLPRGLTRLEIDCSRVHPPAEGEDHQWPLGLTRLRFKPEAWHYHDAHQLVNYLPALTHLHLSGVIALGAIKRLPPAPSSDGNGASRPSSPPAFPPGFFASNYPPLAPPSAFPAKPYQELIPSADDTDIFSKPVPTPILDFAMLKRDIMRQLAPLTCEGVVLVGELEDVVVKSQLETLIWTTEEKTPALFSSHLPPPARGPSFFEPTPPLDPKMDPRAIAEATHRKPFEISLHALGVRSPFGAQNNYAVTRLAFRPSEYPQQAVTPTINSSNDLAQMHLSQFTALTDLEISKECLNMATIRRLPKSLLHLKIVLSDEELLDPFSDFPPRIQTLMIDSASPILLTSLGAKLIPASLTKLHCNRLRIRPNLAPLLPLHVTDLSFESHGWWTDTHIHELGERYVAAGVKDFSLSTVGAVYTGALLPRDFAGALNLASLRKMTNNILGPNYHIGFDGFTNGEMKFPTGVTSLDLHRLNLAKLPHPMPSGLTKLTVRLSEKLECDRIEALPPNLRELEIQFTSANTFDGYLWSTLPRDLEHLRLLHYANTPVFGGSYGMNGLYDEEAPLMITAPYYASITPTTSSSISSSSPLIGNSDLGPIVTIASLVGLPSDRLQSLEMPYFRLDARCMNYFGPALQRLTVHHLEEASRLNLGRAENGFSIIELSQAVETDRYIPMTRPSVPTGYGGFTLSALSASPSHREKPDVVKLRRDFYNQN